MVEAAGATRWLVWPGRKRDFWIIFIRSLSSGCMESFGAPSLGLRILRIPLVQQSLGIFRNLFRRIIVIVLAKHKIIANFQTFSL